MEKYKKANELDKTLRNLKRLANIPLREFVADQLYKQKNVHGEPKFFLVAKNHVFEILENLADSARRRSAKIFKLFQMLI